jgi:hypothetical protein
LFPLFATSVFDTSGKFATGKNITSDTSGKFTASAKFATVLVDTIALHLDLQIYQRI